MTDVVASAPGREPIRLSNIADFSLGELRVRPSLREVERAGVREQLEPRVMQVLVALAAAEGAVVSRDHLIARCWEGRIVGDDAITNAIVKVRALAVLSGDAPFEIETIPRIGYRLLLATPARAPADDVGKEAPPPAAPLVRSSSKAPYAWIAVAVVLGIALALAVYEMGVRRRAPPPPSAGPVQASIAVLPFKNLSSDKDTGYLADGVQDEILTRLARIGSLKVISRTSTEEFASHAPNIRDIARRLGVANLLEGNVQKSGNRIRINVQLIRAANDDHLWAEDYDRSVDDMLSVESDVAGTIASVLAAKMTPHERAEVVARPTNNPRAYDLYLQGLVFANKNDTTSLQTATQLLTEATRLDPTFALAWARLSRTEAYRYFSGDDSVMARKDAARAALAKALSLQPDLPEVQAAKGFYLYYGEMNYPAAERELERVHAKWPNNAEALEALALVLRRTGKWKESREAFKKLIALDPLVPAHRLHLAILLLGHDLAGANSVLDAALRIWPDDQSLLNAKAAALVNLGQIEAAGVVLKNVHPAPDDNDALGVFQTYFWLSRQFAKGAAFFRGLLAIEQQGENRDSVTCLLRPVIGDFLRMEGDGAGAHENFSAALACVQTELKAHPDNAPLLDSLPTIYAGLGQGTKALAIAKDNIRRLRASKDAFDLGGAEGTYVAMEIRFGARSDAVAEFVRWAKPQSIPPVLLRLDPALDRLRGDPRFEALAHSDMKKAN